MGYVADGGGAFRRRRACPEHQGQDERLHPRDRREEASPSSAPACEVGLAPTSVAVARKGVGIGGVGMGRSRLRAPYAMLQWQLANITTPNHLKMQSEAPPGSAAYARRQVRGYLRGIRMMRATPEQWTFLEAKGSTQDEAAGPPEKSARRGGHANAQARQARTCGSGAGEAKAELRDCLSSVSPRTQSR